MDLHTKQGGYNVMRMEYVSVFKCLFMALEYELQVVCFNSTRQENCNDLEIPFQSISTL